MRVKGQHSIPSFCVLLLTIAFAHPALAQKDGTKRDAAGSDATVKTENGATASSQTPASDGVASSASPAAGSQPPDQPATQKGVGIAGAAGANNQLGISASSIADYPPDPDEDGEVPKPRIPLPVILNSDSPSLDRSIKREDLKSVPEDYVIGEEDMLTVSIWKERDLTGAVVVRPDGRITVPLVGEVKVVGLTPLQLETQLEEKLKPFITVPKVSVAVNQINSRKVYLIGQVMREGAFPINSSMTVLQVLAGAGGLRDFAKKKKIYVLRKHGDEEIRFPFDYDAAIRGRNREENIHVEPGDTIVVP
jgi:polysaccharide biosynthesis/export protein